MTTDPLTLVISRYRENIFIDGLPGHGTVHANAAGANLAVSSYTDRQCLRVTPVGDYGVHVELIIDLPSTRDEPLASWTIKDAHRDEPIETRTISFDLNDYPCG